jgi:hypothetical protein
MKAHIREVLGLQGMWTPANTPEMARRGVVVRRDIPAWLERHRTALAAALGVGEDDLGIEGRDGTGLKTEVPWVRVYSKERSPSATSGWYVVYLFGGSGQRVYLSLMQGTTVWTGTDFKPRKPADVRARVAWARPHLDGRVAPRADVSAAIDLDARTSLGRGYESGTVYAVEYRHDALPSADVFARDLLFMTGLLGILYEAEARAPHVPGDVPSEVREAEQAAARTAGRRSAARQGGGQGFLLTAAERSAVERHAVRLATEYFTADGWSVKDVGNRESYDLQLSRRDARLHVEVKGTTSTGEQVILTRSEVERQREYHPHNALVVVHSILLDRGADVPEARGGTLVCTSPWSIDDESLTVVSYVYRTPA